jgi:MoaA/NifB/PqqE/SkfB family radical SAM enzyme
MAPADVLAWLQRGRRQGAEHLWLGGGEPTLRRDFLATLRAARQLGYRRTKVQTNGMLFAYPAFAQKAAAAGMTEVNLLLRTLDPALHDELHQTPGAHVAMRAGLQALQATDARLEGDVLLTTRTFRELPALVQAYAREGLKHFNLWLFSAFEGGDAVRDLVPRLADLTPVLRQARAVADGEGVTLCTLHTPPCTTPPELWDGLFDAAGMALVVVQPDGRAFAMETSAYEQGIYPAVCEACAARPYCRGLRSDYIGLHGDREANALTEVDLAGRDLHGRTL